MKGEYLRLKIKKLEVIKLYNMYDYNIEFNDDITFLHGKNGCGKTTILNIITYIITGRIYKLFSYDFEKIILEEEPPSPEGPTFDLALIKKIKKMN